MKRITIILTAIIMCLSVCFCNPQYTTASGIIRKIIIRTEPISGFQVVPFAGGSYDVRVYYRWCGKGEDNDIRGKILISSDELEIENGEFDISEDWYESCNSDPHYVDHVYYFTIRKDMLKEDSGKIHFEITAETEDSSSSAYSDTWLYFAADGDELCLSGDEGAAEKYFKNSARLEGLKTAVAVIIAVLLVLSIVICLKKLSGHVQKKAVSEE